MRNIYCDNHLLAVEKPAGMSTQNGLDELAKAWIKETYAKPGKVFLEPIHRLDKPVSGIVLFARTSKALSRLNEAMRERQIVKVYHALVEGKPSRDQRILEHFLVHDEFQARVVGERHPEGKKAILEYRLIEARGVNSVLEVILHTGRYHQIRAQLAAMGCAVVGDEKYGSSTRSEAIALRHVRMELMHPVTKAPLVLECGGF